MSVSAASAVSNLRAAVVSRQVPQGRCLNFVWRMFGSLNSTGYAQGTLSTALTAWNGSRDRHTDRNIPIGAPVYFGVSPTRTDRNKYAGDVMIHVGGGILGGTDVNGANTGYTTIEARSRQIQRPYLGYTRDFGGRPINFGMVVGTSAGEVVIVEVPEENSDMQVINNRDTKAVFATDREYARYLGTMSDANLVAAVNSIKDEIHELSDQQFRTILASNGVPDRFWTREGLQANGDVWSREAENGKLLDRIVAKLGA